MKYRAQDPPLLPVLDDCRVGLAVFLPRYAVLLSEFVVLEDVLTAPCVVVSIVVVDVVVCCCVLMLESELLWAGTGCPAVYDSLSTVVVVVSWGNVTAAEPCFGTTLCTTEGVFDASSPKRKW